MSETATSTEKIQYGVDDIVSVERKGHALIVPEGMTLRTARVWLKRREDEEDQWINPSEKFVWLYPTEGAVALSKALDRRYGWTALKAKQGMFGKEPPRILAVQVGPNKVIHCPWGQTAIPGFGEEAYVDMGITKHKGQPRFVISGYLQQKHEPEFKALCEQVRQIAEAESIYKGQAIRLLVPADEDNVEDHYPEFLDVSDTDVTELVFSKAIEEMVEDNVFGPIEHTEAYRRTGSPLKLGVLLEGPYGCGKTLTARILAKKCVDHGWTYVLIDNPDELPRAIEFSKRYSPAVVFCEDIDRAMAEGDRTAAMNNILNTIDGVHTKGSEIMVVLTTNHVDAIHKAMIRPGRLDVVIPVGPPDDVAVRALCRLYGRGLIPMRETLTDVGAKLSGQIPAVIREVVERAKRTSIRRTKGEGTFELDSTDLGRAADGMVRQLGLLKEVKLDRRHANIKAAEVLVNGIGEIVEKAKGNGALTTAMDPASIGRGDA